MRIMGELKPDAYDEWAWARYVFVLQLMGLKVTVEPCIG